MKNIKKFFDLNLSHNLGYQLKICLQTVKFKLNYVFSNQFITSTLTLLNNNNNSNNSNTNTNTNNENNENKSNLNLFKIYLN